LPFVGVGKRALKRELYLSYTTVEGERYQTRVKERLRLSYITLPLPLDKGKGDKGGWGYQVT